MKAMPTQVSPLRLVLFGIVALWVLSLFLPAFRTCDMYVEHEKHAVGDADDGWLVLVFGWLGPAALSWWIGDIPDRTYPAACAALLPTLGFKWPFTTAAFSWYANPLWLFSIFRLAARKNIPWVASSFASILGLLALQPHDASFDPQAESAETPAIGAYVWAVAMTLPLIVSIALQLRRYRPASSP